MSGKADTITVNGETYDVAKMTNQQREILRHVNDLENQIADGEFRLTQIKVAREAFASTLAGLLQGSGEDSTS